ncbi:MAG: DUF6621 family protein [Prevotella sp.]
MIDVKEKNGTWCENVILVDADYIDKVAFDLTVNFERMIGRRIPKADMARWLDCVALDGGLREGDNAVQVVLIHDRKELDNFAPGRIADELDGKAFKDSLGEFIISACRAENIVSRDEFFIEALETVCAAGQVKRVMVVSDADNAVLYDMIRHALRNVSADKRITVFAMQPMTGGNFRQEILGYSLMSALGIRSDELEGC